MRFTAVLLFFSVLLVAPNPKAQDNSAFNGNWLGVACGDNNRITGLSILVVNEPGPLNTSATLNGVIGSDGSKDLKVNLTVRATYSKDSDGNLVLILIFARSAESKLGVQMWFDKNAPGQLRGIVGVVNTNKDGSTTSIGPDPASFVAAPDSGFSKFYDQNKGNCSK